MLWREPVFCAKRIETTTKFWRALIGNAFPKRKWNHKKADQTKEGRSTSALLCSCVYSAASTISLAKRQYMLLPPV